MQSHGLEEMYKGREVHSAWAWKGVPDPARTQDCLLYTSDAADEQRGVDLRGCSYTKQKLPTIYSV